MGQKTRSQGERGLRPEIGVKKTNAQITGIYAKKDLMGRKVVGVVNFPPKQIGPEISELPPTGFHEEDGTVVLAASEREVPNGAKLLYFSTGM